MALFARAAQPDRRRSTATGLSDPVRYADWTVRLSSEWQLLDSRRTTLAVVDPDRSYGVRSVEGALLTQTDIAVVDAEDIAAAGFAGLLNGTLSAAMGVDLPGSGAHGRLHDPNNRAKLRIRDTNSRMIFAECHRAPAGIVIRVLPGGPVNPKVIARTLPAPIADALTASGPWTYRMPAPDRGELRNLNEELLACDTFARSTSSDPQDRRGGLTWWSIRVEANPLPTSWFFALLLACEHLRR
jgi:hypothetical protein